MKRYFLPLFTIISLSLILLSCQEEEPETPWTPPKNDKDTTEQKAEYYGNIKYDTFELKIEDGIYHVGGTSQRQIFGAIGSMDKDYLQIKLTFKKDLSNADILALAGQTFYFGGNDPIIYMECLTNQYDYVYSKNINDNNYFLKINAVEYLRNDKTVKDVEVYKIQGEFKSYMIDMSDNYVDDATGDFSMQFVIHN